MSIMRNMKKFILLLTFVCSTIFSENKVFAQDISPADEAEIMLSVVDLFEEYERYAGIDEDFANYASSLRALFENGESMVYNDLLGISSGQSLSIREYVSLMSEQSSTTRVEIKNIQRESIVRDGDACRIICAFDKYVNITNMCGIEFASDYFNATDYKLVATIVYDLEHKSCLFEKIEGNVEKVRELSEDFRIFKNTSPRDKDVLYNGKPIEFNAMGQAFVSSEGNFYYKDPEVVLKLIEDDPQCRIWHMAYKAKPWRVKPHFDFGLGNAFSMSGAEQLSTSKSSGSSFGLDFGYVIPSKTKIKLGIFAGIGISKHNMVLAYTNPDYCIQTNADVDNDTYYRHYKNLSLVQKEKYSDLSIPVYADVNVHLTPLFSFYVDLGVKLNMSMTHKISGIEGNAYVYGVYPDYDDLHLDEEWGLNGFGNVVFTEENANLDLGKSPSGIDLFGAAGLRVNIPNTPIAVDLGVNYLMGLGSIADSADRQILLNDNATVSNAIVYNSINGKTNSEHIRNLSGIFTSMKHQALRFSIGVLYKF